MKKLFTLILFAVPFLLSSPVWAESKKGSMKQHNMGEHQGHDHKHGKGKHDHSDQKASVKKLKNEKMLIKVNGMVCAFCAQGIKKQFNGRDEVKETQVNLDNMEVLVTLKKGQSLSEDTIKELVTNAGFSFEGLKDE